MRKLCFLFLVTSSFLFAESLTWLDSFDEAEKLSVKTDRPLLLFFTGSDWCGECVQFKERILSHPLFVKEVKGQFVFAAVDFPLNRPLPGSLSKRNQQLKERFKIVGLPTLVILFPSHNAVSMAASSSMPPKRLGEVLRGEAQAITVLEIVMNDFDGKRYSSQQLTDLYATAKLVTRNDWQGQILEAGLQKEKDNGFFLREKYRLLVDNGKRNTMEAENLREALLASDPNNELGYQLYIAVSDFETTLREQKDAAKPLIDFLDHFSSSSKQTWRVKTMLASYLMVAKRYKEARRYLTEALKEAPLEHREAINTTLSKLP